MAKLGILFDLDGTLLDSIELLVQCMEFTFTGAQRAPTREQWIAGIGTPLRQQLAEWADDDAMIEAMVGRYRDYQLQHFERLTNTFPGVAELLRWARDRGHALGVVTSKGAGMTQRSLDHVGITSFFDVIVTVEATTRHKPHPDPVLHALAQLDIGVQSALFVGDSPHDVRAGRAAGVATVACLWGPFPKSQLELAQPGFWAASIDDVQGIIEGFERSNLTGVAPVQMGDLEGEHARFNGDHSTT